MSASDHRLNPPESRVHPRRALPLGYCAVSVRRGGVGPTLTGHAYDISMGGVRFELDEPLLEGEQVELTVHLPGRHPVTIHAHGEVVRMHDEPDEIGPVRMGARFRGRMRQPDLNALAGYVNHGMRAVA